MADPYELLLPLEPPEVWCAGVTYERSRDARIEESAVRDVYSLVYDAERPELFLKDAGCRRTVGPDEPVGIRSDSAWNVPEPEIALVLGEGGAIAGVTIGNDVSSREIEGANPLYLPQAKVFAGACALGPAVLSPVPSEPLEIRMRILDANGTELFAGETSTARMKRSFEELVEFLVRDNPVPPESVLLTGTGLVPPDDFTLEPGHVVEIEVPRDRHPLESRGARLEPPRKDCSSCLRPSPDRPLGTTSAGSGARARAARPTKSTIRGGRPR